MRIFNVCQSAPDPLVVSEVAELLRNGAVIAYPTDTFYGLGADITDQNAIERIYFIKKRLSDKPILILISGIKMLRPLIADGYISCIAERLINMFWPGPLTLVFNASGSVHPLLTASTGKIGIRYPDNEFCRQLIDNLEHPVTATSANISGDKSPDNPGDVMESLGEMVDAIIDGGPAIGGAASSVVDVTGEKPVVIREGVITASMINEAIAED